MDQFNKYFTNIGHKAANDPTKFINNSASHFFSTPTCPTEIINSDFDNIDPYVVKKVIPKIFHILNSSFLTGIVPTKLKIAKIIPLYKS